jgi:uncharacterized protein (TIGR03067 family)
MLAALTALSVAVATADPPKLSADAQKELKSLEGKWKVVKGASSKGEEELDPNKLEVFLVFKGAELTMEAPKTEKTEKLKISALDPTTDPKCIDFLEPLSGGRGERTIEAVFKIDGDTLLLAMHTPRDNNKQRPTGFDKPTDPRTVVWTMQRVKK